MDRLYFTLEGIESANREPQQFEKMLVNLVLTSQRGASRVGDGTSMLGTTLKVGSDMGNAGTKGLVVGDSYTNLS